MMVGTATLLALAAVVSTEPKSGADPVATAPGEEKQAPAPKAGEQSNATAATEPLDSASGNAPVEEEQPATPPKAAAMSGEPPATKKHPPLPPPRRRPAPLRRGPAVDDFEPDEYHEEYHDEYHDEYDDGRLENEFEPHLHDRERQRLDDWVGMPRPAPLRHRSPGVALALGAGIGFGSGYYYASQPGMGLVFALVDVAMGFGFVASTVALNQLVISNDFKTLRSLSRDERRFGKRERTYYVASWLFAGLVVGSRVFQGIGGFRAARNTNTILDSFSFVPLGERGGGLQLERDF